MTYAFYKYHGLGNDFIVIESPRSEWQPSAIDVEGVCARHRGIGADGILVVSETDGDDTDVRMVVYNRDGSRPEMCGNGIRCVAHHVARRADEPPAEVRIATDAGVKCCRIDGYSDSESLVDVDMGSASVDPEPVRRKFDGDAFSFFRVDMGNPHGVAFREASVDLIDRIGRGFNDDPSTFPDGVNVEFVGPVEGGAVEAVVYERGVGRTQACGTGACAVAAAAWYTGRVPEEAPLTVNLPGGPLTISLDDDQLWMKGPATFVFEGRAPEALWRGDAGN